MGILATASATPQAQGMPPTGFTDSVVFSDLSNPTVMRFSPDGRVFVAEKQGIIKVFDSLTDTTPEVFADLNANVYNYWDRGLLGMALDPDFPTKPYVYVLYTYDHQLGSPPGPRWGTPGVYSDPCPTPPGPTDDGCVASGRLSRLTADGDAMTGTEKVLVEDWCQQFPSHSLGAVEFGASGALYASAGEASSFVSADWGQHGDPPNPCGDPPGGVGGTQSPPSAEGGSLRAQDLRTSGDPVGLDGAVIRVDPATGDGLPDNPYASSDDPNARRIVAYGFRNPFRLTERPGTGEVWVADVGQTAWEELDRFVPSATTAPDFGWPCYEGPGVQPSWDALDVSICEGLYSSPGAVTAPFLAYQHGAPISADDSCLAGSSAIAGLAFVPDDSPYPASYDGALFFSDYTRGCIWVMPKGADGNPDAAGARSFIDGAAHPVDLQMSPAGELFYVDYDDGTIHRITYSDGNHPPNAVATGTPDNGLVPLLVQFDGSGSSDQDAGDTLSYAWDLDGDGAYDDSTAVKPTFTYTTGGTQVASLKVTDSHGASSTASVSISAGVTAPVVTIDSPADPVAWRVGDVIDFSGHATEDGNPLPDSALTWNLVLQHCPSNCHAHQLQTLVGVDGGSIVAPDHESPSYLEVRLTATGTTGLTTTVTRRLDPLMVKLTFSTDPRGLPVVVDDFDARTPFSWSVIVGSSVTISALQPGPPRRRRRFASWSDGGAVAHVIVAPALPTKYKARFK